MIDRSIEVVALLRQNMFPSRIAGTMKVGVESVLHFLYKQVGMGRIKLSDIYFSWPRELRQVMQRLEAGEASPDLEIRLMDSGITKEERALFQAIRREGVLSGDMYDFIASADTVIHRLVRSTLEKTYGPETWWREGVPEAVRLECVIKQERDPDAVNDPFMYTTLNHLSHIIADQWPIFRAVFPQDPYEHQEMVLDDLKALKRIRNAVMHPVKGLNWTEEDFDFARMICKTFQRLDPAGEKKEEA
jgi:hypothetical protein